MKSQKREDFFKDEINLERAVETLKQLVNVCTLKEILWIIRNITYDMISYWDEENKGIIYKDKEYSTLHREQATHLQRDLSSCCDLFSQSIINKREFPEEYLDNHYDFYRMSAKIEALKEKIKKLEEKIEVLKNEED